MRFILIVVLLAFAALAGLFLYGQMAQPEMRIIEQEALHAADA